MNDEEKNTKKAAKAQDNEQGRGIGMDLPEANVAPEEAPGKAEVPEDAEDVLDLTSAERTVAPVQAPHMNALVDIKRILPCQVQPVNSKDWYTVTDAISKEGQIILITSDGDKLYGREIGDPVLCRTNDPDANLLH